MNIERIETLFSQGTSKYREDGFLVNPPFFGVVDGLSAPYNPREGPLLFNGMSGGEMVRKLILETFYSTAVDSVLEETILQANQRVSEFQTARDISLNRADLLAGASFVFVKIGEKTVKIIGGGDCFAVWVFSSGAIGVTKNTVYKATLENQTVVTHLMEKYNYDRKRIWTEWIPMLSAQRIRDINKRTKTGYALLNGQPELVNCWQIRDIPLLGLKLLVLFSDGLVPFSEMSNEQEMAERVVSIYKKGGLGSVLERTRKIEKGRERKAYVAQAEATAIAIRFK